MAKNKKITKQKQSKTNNSEDVALAVGIILGIFVGVFLLSIILVSSGAFNTPLTELGINESIFAEKYLKHQYPEYENCTTSAFYNMNGKITMDVYCNIHKIDQRDGLTPIVKAPLKEQPDATIEFNDITVEKIAKTILEDYEYTK